MSSSQAFNIAMLADPSRGAVRMSCQNFGCVEYTRGWVTVLDRSNPRHAAALNDLKRDGTRRFIELESENAADWVANHGAAQGVTDSEGQLAALIARTPPGLLLLLFHPGQQCLRPHWDREVVFAHADARRNVRVHERFEDYREHWDEEAYRVNELMRRG